MANNIYNVLKAVDKVLEFPSTTIQEACEEYGVNISPTTGLLVGTLMVVYTPIPTTLWMIKKIIGKKKRDQQEKERMTNELIIRRQVLIERLKRENESHKQQNELNQQKIKLNEQEIKNLKDALIILEDASKKLA